MRPGKAIDAARAPLGDVENALLDELLLGRIDRRVFLRHATRLGIGWPVLRALGAAAGLGFAARGAAAEAAADGAAGGTVKAAVAMPHGAIDPILKQRDQDLVKARQLMAAAGVGAGFDVTLTTERYTDIPEYAQLVQNFAKPLGIRIALKIETQALYYGKSIPGQSYWLDSALGITDYAHRGAPNTLLGNPLVRHGPWNAAHFDSAAHDAMVARYVKALDLQAQRSAARDIQELVLDETPLIISYFPDLLVPVRKGVTGLVPIAAGLLLDRVSRR